MFLCCFSLSGNAWCQITDPKATEVWEPEPKVVVAPTEHAAPSDAIVLFDGKSLNQWRSVKTGAAAEWTVEDGAFTVKSGTGDIQTADAFGDCQLHLEFRTPAEVVGEGQGRGNSGVFLQGRYEVQILDSYQNRTYSNGQSGAIYKQYPPLVNASRGPGEWQTYDIVFMAPRFDVNGQEVRAGTLTVFHNGVLIQNHREVQGTTEYIGLPKKIAHVNAPIKLQDHGNPMSFRNIWLRKL